MILIVALLYCSEVAVSIKTALEEAEKGHLGSYLAITDSILGVIKCCPMLLATDKVSLTNVRLHDIVYTIANTVYYTLYI